MEPGAAAMWDAQAATFDESPDHGLLDPVVRGAWRELLLPLIPRAGSRVADLGCGTGSVAVLLAEADHEVHGIDISEAMIESARAKAAQHGVAATFQVGDASDPPYPESSFDVIFARHVLWALREPGTAIAAWVRLLRPGGRLLLVEGRWNTGAGLTAAATEALVLEHRTEAFVQPLTDPALWGRPIDDERYLLVSTG